MPVGYVGVGNMGGALARRLLLAHPLFVYDLNPVAVQAMVEKGATACASLAELAATCETILLCLPTSVQVRQAIFGEAGLASAAGKGTVIIDQTSGDATATRAMAVELAERGIELIDAPVSGGIRGADAGTIAVMVGATPDQFGRIEALLRRISSNVFHAGGIGTGHTMKCANNMMSAANRAVAIEAVALAVKNGVTPEKAVEIIMSGSGRNFWLEHFMQPHIIKGNLHSGFTLGLLHKDVKQACQLGTDTGVPMFVGNTLKEFYQMCMSELGPEAQVNAVALVMDRLAGTHVVPKKD